MREFKRQRGAALSLLQLGAIIPLLCASVMGKRPTAPLERNWLTIMWGGEELRCGGQITQTITEVYGEGEECCGGLIKRGLAGGGSGSSVCVEEGERKSRGWF